MDILAIDDNTFWKWIEHQMNPEMNWSNFAILHVEPILSIDVCKGDGMREAVN